MQNYPSQQHYHSRRNTQINQLYCETNGKNRHQTETSQNRYRIQRKRTNLKTEANMDEQKARKYSYELSPKNQCKKIRFKHLSTQQNEGYYSLKSKLGQLQNKLAQIKSGLQNRKKSCTIQQKYTKMHSEKPRNKQNSSFLGASKALRIKVSQSQQNNAGLSKLQKRSDVQSPKSVSNGTILAALVTQVQPISPLTRKSSQTTHHARMGGLHQPSQANSSDYYYIGGLVQEYYSNRQSQMQQGFYRSHFETSHNFFHYFRTLCVQSVFQYPQCPSKFKMSAINNSARTSNSSINKVRNTTLVFDLDETLIHCKEVLNPNDDQKYNQKKIKQADICLNIQNIGSVLVNIRPYCRQMLTELSQHFEIILFTASHKLYANAVADYIDPNNNLFQYRLFREHCYKTTEGFYAKDLRILDRPLDKMLLIDNAAYSYCLQPDNGVPIIPFYYDKNDSQLQKLESYLKQFINEKDMRLKNRYLMKNHEYVKYSSAEQFIMQAANLLKS